MATQVAANWCTCRMATPGKPEKFPAPKSTVEMDFHFSEYATKREYPASVGTPQGGFPRFPQGM